MFGPRALQLFSKAISSIGAKYWLFWGTLLGAYRDNGFIFLDEDIDVGMFFEDMTVELVEELEAVGFTCLYVILDKDIKGGLHFAFDYKGVKFDIYSFTRCPGGNKLSVISPLPYNYKRKDVKERTDIWEEVHAIVPIWDKLIPITFEGVSTYIPSNADDILKILYGDDYMTPMPGSKPHDEYTSFKIHENPMQVYACLMSFETFKMMKKYISF